MSTPFSAFREIAAVIRAETDGALEAEVLTLKGKTVIANLSVARPGDPFFSMANWIVSVPIWPAEILVSINSQEYEVLSAEALVELYLKELRPSWAEWANEVLGIGTWRNV